MCVYIYVYIYIYVIYKPRLVGVLGSGFISGKLPLTSDSGRIFVEYAVLAMVHIIYTMETSH